MRSQTDIRSVRVLLNGRPLQPPLYATRDLTLSRIGTSKYIEELVSLQPDKNELAIIAGNEDATSAPSKRIVYFTPPRQPVVLKPNLYVLAIGKGRAVSRYLP